MLNDKFFQISNLVIYELFLQNQDFFNITAALISEKARENTKILKPKVIEEFNFS